MVTYPVLTLICFGFSIFFVGCYIGLSIGQRIANQAFEEIYKILDIHEKEEE